MEFGQDYDVPTFDTDDVSVWLLSIFDCCGAFEVDGTIEIGH